MSLKIYSYENNYRVWKTKIVAEYNQIDIEEPAFDFDKDIKSEEFKKKTPVGKVPVLETPYGNIFESGAIARYVARLRADTNLLGASNIDQARVDMWLDWCQNDLEPARGIWLYPIVGYLTYNEKAYTEAKKEINTAFTILNNHLLRHTYMVGNAITLADITIVTALVGLFTDVLTPNFLKPYGNVVRWFTTCINQPEFAAVLGKIEFAKEEKTAAKAEKKKEEKPAKAASAPAEKPKAEKKEEKPAAAAAAPAKSEHEDLLEDEDKPKPKKKNPLDDLPPSSMDLDTTKKLMFSKRPFLPDFFEQLWTFYDNAGYSCWTMDYNYNADNKEYWKIGNTLGGFIQRSDACRKYAMGVIQVSGPEDEECSGPWIVNGAWLFRGTEMLPEMKEENPDSDYYTWTKLDVTTEEGKKKFKEYFVGETVNGQKVLDRRFFK